jgi:hypothetical protein
MRYIPLIYQNTKAGIGLSLEAKEALAGYCIVDAAAPERAAETTALMHGGGEEG